MSTYYYRQFPENTRFVIELSPGQYLVNLTEITNDIGKARHYDHPSSAKTILNTVITRFRKADGWPWNWAEIHRMDAVECVSERGAA